MGGDQITQSQSDDTDATASHGERVALWRRRSQRRRRPRPWWVEVSIVVVAAFLLTFTLQTFVAKVFYVPSASMDPTLHGTATGGDRILVNRLVYDFRDPRPGDIVVFRGDDHWHAEAGAAGATTWYGQVFESLGAVVGIAPPHEKDFVKRVIAVGGQNVECCDEQGAILVDGIALDEHYVANPLPFAPGDPALDCTVSPSGLTFASRRCFGAFTVPEGQLMVLGDNRSYSDDSLRSCQGLTSDNPSFRLNPDSSAPVCAKLVDLDDVIGKAVLVIMPIGRWHTLGDPGTDVGGP